MEPGTAVFADQFENQANFRAHLKTGEEIWRQTGGRLDAFVSGAGTGGTIAGVSRALKAQDPSIKVRVAASFTRPEMIQGTSGIFHMHALDNLPFSSHSSRLASANIYSYKLC